MYEPPPKNFAGDGISDYGKPIVTTQKLADVLGLSETHIYNLKRRNIIQSVKPKRNHLSRTALDRFDGIQFLISQSFAFGLNGRRRGRETIILVG
jgi:hypothetical protein